jgi:aspartyl-tRNA(Asn)/glutamyl-tRNA(Gln) amidotransferase subunit A
VPANSLCFQSINESAAQIAAGTLSPVELCHAYLEHIEAREPVLNAYIEVAGETAMKAAHVAEAEISRNGTRSPLHGIPLAHKDIIDVAGLPTSCGSRVLQNNLASRNATVINRLEAAGAIVLGKLNMNEFATLVPSEVFGPTVNPWNGAHSPGGSSSGSGVAVAAGLCAAALGTDTGGSIRLPATFCGVTGLKATHGRISSDGVVPLAWSLDHVGPLTRDALDASLMYDALAGFDAADLTSRDHALTSASNLSDAQLHDLSDLRLAVPTNFFSELTDPQVASALAAACDVFSDRGARIESIALPELDGLWSIADAIIGAEASTSHAEHLRDRVHEYGEKVRKFLLRGQAASAQDYVRARGAKARFKRKMLSCLETFDALLVPGALIPAPPLGARTVNINNREISVLDAVISATCPFNLSGQPALSLPSGFSSDGLPLGLQIVCRPWQEHVALRMGQAYQTATDWHLQTPPASA